MKTLIPLRGVADILTKVSVFGVLFDAVSREEAVSEARKILEAPDGGRLRYAITPNPEIVNLARRDRDFREIINSAALVLPDGIGVVYASRIMRTPIRERVTGIDFAEELLYYCAGAGKRIFLLGAKPGVAALAKERLEEKIPGLLVAGTRDGYFSDARDALESINGSGADLLLCCLGSPKQERFMADNADLLKVKLGIGLGGALDVWSGKVKRAPKLMQRFGFEWLYRLCREPKRFFRMIKLPLFLLSAIRERVKPNHAE